MTDREIIARHRFAALSGRPEHRWFVVRSIEIGCWYDFYSPSDGKYGQCCMGENGKWKQDPRGGDPVILGYREPRKGRRQTA